MEILACYEPSFRFMAEWWKQLYGESEGKDGKGLFPASVEFTADLHSMGQYIQQGERLMLETVVRFARSRGSVTIPHDPDNVDGLNFLAGKDLSFVAEQAMRGTLLAHVDGGVPNIRLIAPLDAVDMHRLMARSYMVMTDSGGIQEEAPFLGKPVLVMRNTTERPEGIAAGTLKLVGTEEGEIYRAFTRLLTEKNAYEAMAHAASPYGQGYASSTIADVLEAQL